MTNVDPARLPCSTCSGTGTDTHEDRHAGTNRDTCQTCDGTGTIPARTGESPEASFGFVNQNTTATDGKVFPKTGMSFPESGNEARTQLTEAGQKLADALVKAGVIITWTYTVLNTAAQILLTPEGGGGLREAASSGKFAHHAHGCELAAMRLRADNRHGLADSAEKAAVFLRKIEAEYHNKSEAGSNNWRHTAAVEVEAMGDKMDSACRECSRVFADGFRETNPFAPAPPSLAPRISVPGNDAGMREAVDEIVAAAFATSPSAPSEAQIDRLHRSATALYELRDAALSPPTGSAGGDETGVREAAKKKDADYDLVAEWIDWNRTRKGDVYVADSASIHCLRKLIEEQIEMSVSDALAPQPPKAETPAGVGEDAKHHAITLEQCALFVDSEPLRRGMVDAAAFLRSLAPAARAEDGVERYSVPKDKHRSRIQAIGAAISRRDWSAVEQAHADIRDAFDRPDIYELTAAPAANGEGA